MTAVTRNGASEDYGTPSGVGPNVLPHAVDAYVYTRDESRRVGEAFNRVAVSYVLVEPVVEFAIGDVLTIERSGTTETRAVVNVRNSQVDGLPPQPVRLEL